MPLWTIRHCVLLVECCAPITTLQNHARSIALDAYVLKILLDVQIRPLGAENDQQTEMINLVGKSMDLVLTYCHYDIYSFFCTWAEL